MAILDSIGGEGQEDTAIPFKPVDIYHSLNFMCLSMCILITVPQSMFFTVERYWQSAFF